MNLNDRDWAEFRVGDLFRLEPTKGIVSDDLIEGFDVPYIAAKHDDNGMAMYCSKDGFEDWISKGNCIIFINLGAGSAGYANYINEDFIGMSGKTTCGYNDNLNEYNGSFIATILCQERPKYSFGRSWTGDRLKGTNIKLPIDSDGNPDWQFMEDYIKSLHHKPLTTKNKSGQTPDLNVQTWGEFRVGDLFDIHPTKFIDGVSSDDCVGYGHPLVVNSAENNGVAGLCDIEPTENGNIITFSDTTDGNTFFYQPKPFIGFAHVQGMYPKNSNITDKVMLFISTMLMFDSKGRYSYGRKMRRDTISEVMLKLPTDANGNPDWQFMENYIKSLPYGDRLEG